MKIKICPNRVLKIMLTIILILTVLHVSQLTIYCIVADEEVFDFIKMLTHHNHQNLYNLY